MIHSESMFFNVRNNESNQIVPEGLHQKLHWTIVLAIVLQCSTLTTVDFFSNYYCDVSIDRCFPTLVSFFLSIRQLVENALPKPAGLIIYTCLEVDTVQLRSYSHGVSSPLKIQQALHHLWHPQCNEDPTNKLNFNPNKPKNPVRKHCR